MKESVTDLGLNKPDGGSVPETRIKDADHGVQIVQSLLEANRLRAVFESKVKGMLDGNPPYSPEKLRNTGQSYRCNVNFRESESIHSAALSPYYDLFAEAPYYAEVALDNKKDDTERVRASKVATEELDRMLKSYDGFDYNMQLAISDMVDYGKGFVFWADLSSWWFKAIKQSRVLVPDGTKSDVDQLEVLAIRQSWQLHELWGMVKDKESASEVGWNVTAVLNEMANATSDSDISHTTTDIEQIQQKVRNNDIFESTQSDTVKAAHLFIKEFDGTVTHYIVPEEFKKDPTGQEKKGVDFLFKSRGKYKSFRQALGALFYDIGDGTWHSIKGLLIKMYPFIEVKNRLSCSTIDNTFLTMSVLVQPTTERAFQESGLQQIGPLSILKNGLEVRQWGLSGRLEEGLAVERSLENRLSSNIGQYRTSPRREQGNPETATEVRANVAKETTLTRSAVSRAYAQFDFIYREVYSRVIADDLLDDDGGPNTMALEFQKRCKDRGVPLSALKKFRHVRAYRNIGNGSPFLRTQAIQEIGAFVQMMPEQGRQNFLDDAISVSTNQEMVQRYNPKVDQQISTHDEVDARLQAAAMKNGVLPVITPEQNNIIFARVYLEEAASELQTLQQGKDPRIILAFLEVIGPEIARRIQLASQDSSRKQEVEVLTEKFKALAKVTDDLRKQVEQQAKAQAENQQKQQQLSFDQQLKAEQAKADIQLESAKTKSDIERRTAKTNLDLSLKEQKTRQAMRLAEEKASR